LLKLVKSGTVAGPKTRISSHQFSILVSYLSLTLCNRRHSRDLANNAVRRGFGVGGKKIHMARLTF
jgi:hypothetical protein